MTKPVEVYKAPEHFETKILHMDVKPKGWLYRLYEQTLENANSKRAFWLYVLVSFAEVLSFPCPQIF
jgi:hypothetical protein